MSLDVLPEPKGWQKGAAAERDVCRSSRDTSMSGHVEAFIVPSVCFFALE